MEGMSRPGRYLEQRRNALAIVLFAALAVGMMLILMGFVFWPMSVLGLLLILYFDGQAKDGRLLDPTSWIKGLRGERAVGKALEDLPASFVVIHDLDVGRGNVDHVVIGPTGVFAIETKEWSGRFAARGGRLLHNGREDLRTRKQAIDGALQVRKRLAAAGLNNWVEAVIVSSKALVQNGKVKLPQVTVLDVAGLPDHVLQGRQGLSVDQVARAAEAVIRPLSAPSA